MVAEQRVDHYYRRRETQEQGLAATAATPAIRNIHATLAKIYARLAVEDRDPSATGRFQIVEE